MQAAIAITWKVLGLERGADGDAVKKAFRKLARQHHPDVNPGDKAAEARFKEISEATRCSPIRTNAAATSNSANTGIRPVWAAVVLALDLMLISAVTAISTTSSMTSSAALAPAEHQEHQGDSPAALAAASRAPPPAANLDAEASIKISLGEAFRGCERTLQVNQERVQVRILAGSSQAAGYGSRGRATCNRSGRRGDLYLTINLDSHPLWTLDGDVLRAATR